MKEMRIFEALGKVDENLIAEASPNNALKNKFNYKRWIKRVAIAACIGLFLIGGFDTLQRFDYLLGASCGADLGRIIDGVYYYPVEHKGIMKYTPDGESELVLHSYWFGEEWSVNDYGIYYRDEMDIYVREHETGKRTKLYTADSREYTHVRFTLVDNNVIVTNYNKHKEFADEILIDGTNGDVIETVMDKISYDEAKSAYYSDMHFTVGDREITLEPVNEERDAFIVLEDGEVISPKDYYVTRYPNKLDGILILRKYTGIHHENSFVIYADGTNKILDFPINARFTGNDEYLYYPEVFQEAIGCFDAHSGESWFLEIEANGMDYHEMHNVVSDGEYMYTCGPAGGETTLWKLLYDEAGRPVKMQLLDNDIKS